MESDRIKRSRFTYIARRNQVSRKLNVEMHIHNRVVTALMLSVGGFASRRLLLLSTLLVWTQDSRISSKLYISFIFKREKTFTDSYNISWSPSALKSRQGTDKGRQQRSKPPNHQICGKTRCSLAPLRNNDEHIPCILQVLTDAALQAGRHHY